MRTSEHMVGGMDFSKLKVSQVMEQDVESFEADSGWLEMASVMTRRGFGSVPVIDKNDRLIGIVSEYDLLEVLLANHDPKSMTASEIMTEDPVCTTEDAAIADVMELAGIRVEGDRDIVGRA